ncbi:hypothetical protein GCM10009839_41450 [Catenulispora yoronensis]|uniref:Uncharacterized protein n=1 Tax=Catenulispora yoronensis TaxID=450799 RepID=A0ABN2UHF7_9ACTN
MGGSVGAGFESAPTGFEPAAAVFGLASAAFGLGLAAVGRPGYINLGRSGDLPADRSVEAMRSRAHALLDAAYAHGVRYEALAITVDGVRLFDSVQATYNLLEPSAGPALSESHDAGCTVIVKEALANGRLTSQYLEQLPKGAPELRDLARLRLMPEEAEQLVALAIPPGDYWHQRSRLAWN